jgi:hypothetical protein
MNKVVSLRDAKRGGGGPPDGNDRPPRPEPDSCPITFLGTHGGRYWFFAANGEKRDISARDLGSSPIIISLFGGKLPWLAAMFPAYDREGNITKGFAVRDANAWMVERSEEAGLFDPTLSERGIGVWRVGDGLAVHTGRHVRHFAPDAAPVDRLAGFVDWGSMWPRHAAAPMPEAPGSVEDARWLLKLFERWTWERSAEGAVFFGVWAAGLLGAAIGWRPHALVVGGPGTGKSTLMGLYAATSPLAFTVNDFTEPGLRQVLTGRAAPMVLDEAEGDQDGQAKLQRVIELLRRASGGDGAKSVKGDSGGTPKMFTVNSAAVLGAILPPALLPQDASRITRLDLWPRAPDSADLPDEAEIARARALAPALWGRALAGLGRFRENLALLRAELLARGCTPRFADQLGTILAAGAMMLSDSPVRAAASVDHFSWLVQTEAQVAEAGGPQAALSHLLASPADITRNGERPTIGALVRQAIWDSNPDDARRILGEHGLRVTPWPLTDPGGPIVLIVGNDTPRLRRIYADTAWTQARWRDDLRRLAGTFSPATSIRIGPLPKARGVAIPLEHLPPRPRAVGEIDDERDDPPM